MKILLDNCVHVKFKDSITGHTVEHVLDRGWDQLANGRLLDAADQSGFDVLVTVDQGMRFQQNLSKRRISLVTLQAKSLALESLQAFAPTLLEKLGSPLPSGSSIIIGGPSD